MFNSEKLAYFVLYQHQVRGSGRVGRKRLFWVEQHACAKTHAPVVALENVVVHTPLATLPKLFIVGKLGECHRLVAHARVKFHHWKRCCDAENLGVWESGSRELECFLLYASSQSEMTVSGIDNEPRSGHEVTVSPALDVTEANELVAVSGHHSFASRYLRGDIFGRTPRYACASLQSRLINKVADSFSVASMLLACKFNYDVIWIH